MRILMVFTTEPDEISPVLYVVQPVLGNLTLQGVKEQTRSRRRRKRSQALGLTGFW